ncbi:ABC transporter ATP-binding protein [Nocardioides pocheonensis]|uniref:ATP-binding cassette domain-containing protein n=1 Tax=Nocardioides pocheonensis TaxID=661485 RepID=A0A3N0GMS0_9ACTN|nr:ABC transporter ATP-binding protein [Nocardioides pocheonensis]RNM13689.1 ATP-binding cassette domain-containing protein [Nocardioides pocheonensis]
MIEFDGVSFSYDDRGRSSDGHLVLSGADFVLDEGELTLVVGPTGSGKSTLLRCINGLVPHFSGGTLHGRVVVDGRDTRTHRPRDLADVVGVVLQDPVSSFVTDTVEEELAYGMEALGVDAVAMRRRVEETLDLLGLADVRSRPLRSLSGGQQQRVAIGAVLASGPRILVLDEPTSALDPVAAEDVLASLHRLVHDLGLTVVVAEHRLERVIHHADRILLIDEGRVSPLLDPAEAMVTSPIHPPVIALGRHLGWSPLPLSVRDARRRARDLRATLPDRAPAPPPSAPTGEVVCAVDRLVVRRGGEPVLRGVDLDIHDGDVVAVMGRNGAGKSTLLATLVGQLVPMSGSVRLGPPADSIDPARARPAEIVVRAGMVPQDPATILYADSVAEECRAADRDFHLPTGTARAVLDRIAPGIDDVQHPRELSEGQRLSLALSLILASEPRLVLLDEPTRGLDYQAKRRLVELLRELAAAGHGIVLATHDVELAAEVATRVVVLAEGEVVADGPAAGVLAGSPAFAPQVAKILHPLHLLTVEEVVACTGAAS